MNFRAYIKMLRVRNWVGYFLISVLGYAIFTKLNAGISETLLFYALVCLYLGFVFSVNNCFDVKEDLLRGKKNNPVATGEIKQKEGMAFSLLLALLGMLLSLFRGLATFCFFSVLALLSFSYSSPPFRLKSRPFLDLLSHGLFFGALLFLFPAVFFSTSIEIPHVFLAFSVFYFSVILELRNHMEDYEGDRKAGVRTAVCALGISTSEKITYCLSLLFPLFLLPVFHATSSAVLLPFLITTSIFYPAFCTWKHYRILDIYSNISYLLIMLGVLL